MRSYEVLKVATDRIGVKALAAKLKLSQALIYKWCQEHDTNDPDGGGARNPLDRLAEIIEATEHIGAVEWLCHESDGFFVPNPPAEDLNKGTVLLANTQRLVEEFSRLLRTVTRSIEDDDAIEPAEADRIRMDWERLKSSAESFVTACERGMFLESSDSSAQPGA